MTVGQGLYGLSEPALPPRKPSRWHLFGKIILMIAAVVCTSLTVLHYIGGSTPALKKAVEKYLTESTGYKASIGRLNAVSFYPLVGIDVNDVIFTDPKTKETVATLSHGNFSTSFWSVSSGSDIHTLNVSNLVIAAGVAAPGKIEIERFYIDAKDPQIEQLVLNGTYAGKKVSLQVGLSDFRGLFGSTYFELGNPAKFTIQAGDILASGNIRDGSSGRQIDIEHFEAGKKLKPVKMSMVLTAPFHGVRAAGKIELGASTVDYDLTLVKDKSMHTIRGKVNGDRLDLDDLIKTGGLMDDFGVVKSFYLAGTTSAARTKYDFSGLDLEADLDVEHLLKAGIDFGKVDAKAVAKGNVLSIDPLAGSIKGGILVGKITLDANQAPAVLTADMTIRQADYTSMSKMLDAADDQKGRADLKLALTAKGNNGDELWSDLTGKATIIAGPGGLKSPLINLWGGGLLNTMLPSLGRNDALRLNCGIGDFVIEGGRAKARTLFLDTDHVTVIGEGSINLTKSTINMTLDPKSKETAFFSAATSVNVSGQLDHPRIEPDALSLGKKLGSLVLGAINPAYLAFSLTDMGESDSHPCHAYFKK